MTIRRQPLAVHEALHRSLAHVSYHVGQIVYAARSLRGQHWTFLSIAPGGSEAYNEVPTIDRAAAHTAALTGLTVWDEKESPPTRVNAFYERIWNNGELAAVPDLLSDDFWFRGSLGSEMHGRASFTDYVSEIRTALADYRCEILDCVAQGNQAFARMKFSGRHVGLFRGYAPTRKKVSWLGAALFRFEASAIAELWVLGDLARLDEVLNANRSAS